MISRQLFPWKGPIMLNTLDAGQPGDLTVPSFLWAYHFHADGRVEKLNNDASYTVLETVDGWIWIHMSLADDKARRFIANYDGLPEEARATLIDPDEHLCVEVTEGTVHGIFSDLQRDLGGKTTEIGKLHFSINEHLVVSTRRFALHAVEETRRAIDKGKPLETAVDLLEEILQQFSSAVAATFAEVSQELDHIEDRVLDHGLSDERQKLIPIRRLAAQMHRQLQALSGLFRRLELKADPRLPSGLTRTAGHLSQGLDALDHEAINLQDRARLLHEEINSQVTSETNDRLHLLSIITALMLPPTLVTGMFGMNAKDVAFGQTDGGFYYAVFLCLLSSGIAYLILRKFKIVR